jgi:hypothetical protein
MGLLQSNLVSNNIIVSGLIVIENWGW